MLVLARGATLGPRAPGWPPAEGPGDCRPTPPVFAECVDAGVANVRMFPADDATYYRTAGPLALDSRKYAVELEEVRAPVIETRT